MEARGPPPINLTVESARLEAALKERRRSAEADGGDKDGGDFGWLACKDFTVEGGKRQIRACIDAWHIQARWVYSLDFLCSTGEGGHWSFCHYRARFSTPTPQRPIRGTVSVYFAAAVSEGTPDTRPVEVVFAIESSSLVHTPGRTAFREKWLADVIENKALLQRAADL